MNNHRARKRFDKEVVSELEKYLANEIIADKNERYPGLIPDKKTTILSTTTNNELFLRYWIPSPDKRKYDAKQIKGIIFYYHGINTHSGLIQHLAQIHLHEGYIFVAHDHASFGRSKGEKNLRGHVSNFNVWVYDCLDIINYILSIYKNLPFFIHGVSMGGLIAIKTSHYIYSNKLYSDLYKGSIFQAPAIIPSSLPHPIMILLFRFIAHTCGKCFWDKQIVPRPDDDDAKYECWSLPVCENGIYERIDTDPLKYDEGMRLSIAFAIKNTAEQLLKETHLHQYPYLILHGTEDGVIDISGTKQFYQSTGTLNSNKKMIIIPQAKHCLTYEPNTPDIMVDIFTYCDEMI